jgi:hypothetical protein
MTILLIIGILIAVYLAIAAGVYFWLRGDNPNTMQRSMLGFVALMALFWPLGLVLWALDQGDKEHDKEQP